MWNGFIIYAHLCGETALNLRTVGFRSELLKMSELEESIWFKGHECPGMAINWTRVRRRAFESQRDWSSMGAEEAFVSDYVPATWLGITALRPFHVNSSL